MILKKKHGGNISCNYGGEELDTRRAKEEEKELEYKKKE